MRKYFNNVLINYRVKRNNENNNFVLLLHGWGGSISSFQGLEDYLFSQGFSTINLDFPGFGSSSIPSRDFLLEDYVITIKELLNYENISKTSIVCHSFGGRVALLLSSTTNLVNKMILVDSAGLKPRFNLIRWFKIKIFKLKKILNNHLHFRFNLDKYGSEDYKALPNEMRQTFNNIVSTDLTKNLDNIIAPCLIVWGDKDKSTPLYMAKKLNKQIKNSELKIYRNSGHFSYLENFGDFCELCKKYLLKKEIE